MRTLMHTVHLLVIGLALLDAKQPVPKAPVSSISPGDAGCADGTREAFRSLDRYPDIAGCSGGFAMPGVVVVQAPACARHAGNDSRNPTGDGCNVSDLCATGWHVCTGAKEVASRSPDGCTGALDSSPGTFFVTRQSGPGYGVCATGTQRCAPSTGRLGCLQTPELRDDFFGCGDFGPPASPSCAPLNRSGGDNCETMPRPWKCSGHITEAATVTKHGAESGGVLCCRDRALP
jgi:hypothetical protein